MKFIQIMSREFCNHFKLNNPRNLKKKSKAKFSCGMNTIQIYLEIHQGPASLNLYAIFLFISEALGSVRISQYGTICHVYIYIHLQLFEV